MNTKQQLQQLPQHSLPHNLHARIMRKVFLVKFRTPFIAMMLLLVVNLIVSGWRMWTILTEREAFSIIKALLEGFEVSWSFANDFVSTLGDVLPMAAMVSFLTSLLAISYLAYLWFKVVQFQRSNELINW